MARIIESGYSTRRIIKLSSDDVISVVREYQRVTADGADYIEKRDLLENNVFYLPEDV